MNSSSEQSIIKTMDSTLNPEENAAYKSAAALPAHHWYKLAARSASEAAMCSRAEYAGGVYTLPLFGRMLAVDPVARKVSFRGCESDPGYQRAMCSVLYLASSTDELPSGIMASPRELPGGSGFFRGPHSPPTSILANNFGSDPDMLTKAGLALGGEAGCSGDASAILTALPKIRMEFLVWKGDEEFGHSAAILIDSLANRHLALDALWALMNLGVAELSRTRTNFPPVSPIAP